MQDSLEIKVLPWNATAETVVVNLEQLSTRKAPFSTGQRSATQFSRGK